MKATFLENEFWYGGAVRWGSQMPVSDRDEVCFSLSPNLTPNQAMPIFLSSRGRVLSLEDASFLRFSHGTMEYDGTHAPVFGGENLREAYLAAMKAHFPFGGTMPAEELFDAPVFNTWIELTFFQTQEAVLDYGKQVLDAGFEPGVLMIDDGWSECYGSWRFHEGKFPNPKEMLQQLHHMGFRVMVWVCPYVTPDSVAYREALEAGHLLLQKDGAAYIARWWNGCSAVVDLGKESACRWLHEQFEALQALGVDGFKFDGGDAAYIDISQLEEGALSPNDYCNAWTQLGERYPFNEYRAAWKAGGRPLYQRLCDKRHTWDKDGLAALIPDTLAQGITGHPFCCADMVGGGEYLDFRKGGRLDEELFVRHSGISCLMPSIQFSAGPWRVLSPKNQRLIREQMVLRKAWLPILLEEVRSAAKTGEPMIRYLSYNFPKERCETVTDQFMIGEKWLAAPLLEKNASERTVYVPAGRWRLDDEIIISTGADYRLQSKNALPILLERLDACFQ